MFRVNLRHAHVSTAAACLLAATVFVAAQAPAPPSAPAAGPATFERDIKPILEKHCYECHGPSKARGKLRLHTPAFLLKGGESGAIVQPGNPEQSLMIRRVLGLDDEDRMPKDGDPLPDADIARLRSWIEQGAAVPAETNADAAKAVDEHWAYVKPRRPELPAVKNVSWSSNAIDRFVLARLERDGLQPSPEAAKATLLRRVTLDLIGLPPTLAKVDAFLANTDPHAYEQVVDRLLASPRYGERWARPWLDLARYADTNGFEKDNPRSIWKFRDWVIDALNRDMAFDRFTIEQIAGDMLPDATPVQQIATGFHRNAMTNEEGGVDPDESLYEVTVDRVNTTATVWLGTTLACAQCHDHKYDPFTQKDYFRLMAFFGNTDYARRTFGDGTRYFEGKLDLASPAQERARARLQAKIDRLEKRLATQTPRLAVAQRAWERNHRADEARWRTLEPEQVDAGGGVTLEPLADHSVLASGENAERTTYTLVGRTRLARIRGVRIQALPHASLPRGGPGRDAYGHFRVTRLRVDIVPEGDPNRARPVKLSKATVDDGVAPFEAKDLIEPPAAGDARKRGSWTINALSKDKASRVARHAVLYPESPIELAANERLRVQIDHLDGIIGQGIGRFKVDVTGTPPADGPVLPAQLRAVLAKPAASRDRKASKELASYFRGITPLLAQTREALTAARKALVDLQVPTTLVMKERASPDTPSYELRERGSFTARGQRLTAATPAALHPMRAGLPRNRLGLAYWLVDEENPLVARVAVNRLWEQLFGRGLVETSEDFGVQGTPPTHPELLDWLATELVACGWSQKALLRTMVTSATYRQSSRVTPQLLEKDPYNRLLARGPRFRMEAEMIRDVTLAASGRLSAKMHGPSVFPWQPDGVWNSPFSDAKWIMSQGEDRHRRSLYTYIRRTSAYPSLLTFDATSREYCTVRRVRTNTPLQALVQLNDAVVFDAARGLGARIMAEAGNDTASRARHGFRLCTSREPSDAEVARIVALFEEEAAHYRARPEAARKVTNDTGEAPADLAAWTIVANVLLNLDEALTKN
jgi:mono/diheme cytochrome c family protein